MLAHHCWGVNFSSESNFCHPGFVQTAFLCPYFRYDLADLKNLIKNIKIVSMGCIYRQRIYSGHLWSLNSSSIAKAHIVMNATSTLKQKEVSAKCVKHKMIRLQIVFFFHLVPMLRKYVLFSITI